MLETLFKLKENGTSVRNEILAGITTFMTMAYILSVAPNMLSATGMDKGALFTATVLTSVIGTLLMALIANLPYALAPGMGTTAFFAFTVCIGMGYSWEVALTAIFLEGLFFIFLTLINVREKIIGAIPLSVRQGITVGVGMFITMIGLKGAGIVVDNGATLVTMGDLTSPSAVIAILGIILTGALYYKKVPGSILIGMIFCTLIGLPMGVTQLPESWDFAIPSISPIAFHLDFSWIGSFDETINIVVVLFAFLFIDMFDTIGTLVGVSNSANMVDENGEIKNLKQGLTADSIATVCGALLGVSTVTTVSESAAGIAEGGRTGLTSMVTASFLLIALLLSPLFLMVPAAATTPALFIVGVMMMSETSKINFKDFTEAVPAYFTFMLMPLTYSIVNGIMMGVISYVFIKLLTGRRKEVTISMWILAIVFMIKIFVS
ncbi:NCS2 family permease [Halosquirtibacter xylanolyticus]|uniref:NCS2 family permease n=1 Tax=Halosquirtibacter xylanolyticus TaxID=3374599 RepID=UPI003748A7C7|nr:NCS2 family permease [Prolixibacteraceae bacterium]